jgi:hypothetical protein
MRAYKVIQELDADLIDVRSYGARLDRHQARSDATLRCDERELDRAFAATRLRGVRRGPHRPDVHHFKKAAVAIAAAFPVYSTQERIIMDSKEKLLQKVNTLRQQVENDEMAIFQHELAVKDYDSLPTDAPKDVKDFFLGQKKGAEAEIAKCKQRLATRQPLLVELEAQAREGVMPAPLLALAVLFTLDALTTIYLIDRRAGREANPAMALADGRARGARRAPLLQGDRSSPSSGLRRRARPRLWVLVAVYVGVVGWNVRQIVLDRRRVG